MNSKDQKEKLREIIEDMCEGLLGHGEGLIVRIVGNNSIIIEIECLPSDVALLIGRNGINIQTMRNYVSNFAYRHKFYANVEIITKSGDIDNRQVKNTRYQERNDYGERNYNTKNRGGYTNRIGFNKHTSRKFNRQW